MSVAKQSLRPKPMTAKNSYLPFTLNYRKTHLWPAKAKLPKPIASQNFRLAVRTVANCVVAHVRCIASLAFVGFVFDNWQIKGSFLVFEKQAGKVTGASTL